MSKRALHQRLRTVRRELNAVRRDLEAVQQGRAARHTKPAASPTAPGTGPANRGRRHGPEPAGPHVLVSPGPHPRPDVDAMAAQSRPPAPDAAGTHAAEEQIRRRAARIRDDRFTDYLAGSVQGLGPLRHERRIQRNKAIAMTILIVLVAAWLALKFWW